MTAATPTAADDGLFGGDERVGEVLRVIFTDTTTGFGVVDLASEADGEELRCAGPLADLVVGQRVRLTGHNREHPTYGKTFEVDLYEQLVPQTVPALEAFFGSRRFTDVGERATAAVLAAFGPSAGEVIESQPRRLRAEAGLSDATADELHRQWMAGKTLGELSRLAGPAGVPAAVVRALHARFGAEAIQLAREDPYRLLEVDRCRFSHADALAGRVGIGADDERRLVAGARAAVDHARRRDGHTYLTRAQALQAARHLLEVDPDAARHGLEAAVDAGWLADETVAGSGGGEVSAIYTPEGLRAEQELATQLARVLAGGPRLDLSGFDGAAGELTAGQATATRAVSESAVVVLTGGPGTGKTRTIEEVARAAEAADYNLALCAPTGRAAKRIEELTGRPATTVHRLLEARPLQEGGFAFRYGVDERLPLDLIVCDEVSMCDVSLAGRLVAAVDDGAHLLLVGDPDQLPPVGPGDVLRDLLETAAVPTVELTEIHRQAADSRIVSLAREINAGRIGTLSGNDAGQVFLAEEQRRRAIVPRVVEAVARRAPDYLDVPVGDVQVVAPIYGGPAGVDALNGALKQALNPGEGRSKIAGLQIGDRVMQTRNDAELDVSNGDIGRVVDASRSERTLRVAFPRGEVTYAADRARHLTHAWAVTVHKSQGGEWPVVVMVVDRSHRGMLRRNLVYTAVTRASRALIVVGQSDELRSAARRSGPRDRQTALTARIDAVGG